MCTYTACEYLIWSLNHNFIYICQVPRNRFPLIKDEWVTQGLHPSTQRGPDKFLYFYGKVNEFELIHFQPAQLNSYLRDKGILYKSHAWALLKAQRTLIRNRQDFISHHSSNPYKELAHLNKMMDTVFDMAWAANEMAIQHKDCPVNSDILKNIAH